MTTTPMRIQRRRTRGWRMPPNTKYVGRPGIYSNPFSYHDRGREAVDLYQEWWRCRGWIGNTLMFSDQMDILMGAMFQTEPHPLRGYNQACWCPLCPAHQEGRPLGVDCEACDPCHVDILLPAANP